MSWSSLTGNQAVSGNNLQDAINIGALKLKTGKSFPANNRCLTRSEAINLLKIAPIANDNKLVLKSELQAIAWRGISPFCIQAPDEVLNEFDYLVIRYKWAGGAGRDLDTFTGYINTGTSIDNVFMGFGRPFTEFPTETNYVNAYLGWAGDNMSSNGVEAVLVNFSNVIQKFSHLPAITVRMAAAWYGQKNSGNIDIEIVTYLGGTMQKVGFDIQNVGGVMVQSIQFPKYIPDPPHWTNDINMVTPVGFVTYYKSNKSGRIVITY